MNRMLGLVLLVLCLCVAQGAAAAASARVDRSTLGSSETVQLTLRLDAVMAVREPDFAPLEKDFEILSTSRNARVSVVNGATESYTEWVLELLPLRSGTLTIPPLELGGERTSPITLTVSADPPPESAPRSEVFLEADIDRDSVHVQQQLLFTVRVLHAVNFNRGATLETPDIDNAVVRPLGESSYEKRVNGERYGVFERRYAIFPQASGELQIPSLAFQATVGGGGSFFDAFGSRARTLRLTSPERRVRVLPPQAGADPWIPASVLTLVETWDRSPNRLRVGESATRTLTITATGLTAAQLPVLGAPAVDGLRLYPDKAELGDEERDDGIVGTRTERSAVIPLRAGEMEFPEVRLRWWDTVNERFEEALVPAKTIRVLPASGAAEPAPAPMTGAPDPAGIATAPPPSSMQGALEPAPRPLPWPWVIATALLAALCALSSYRWWRLARAARAPAGVQPATETASRAERELFAGLRAACRARDSAALLQLIPRWAVAAFPAQAPRSLLDVARLADDTQLAESLEALLAQHYARAHPDWDPVTLLEGLERLRAIAGQKASGGRANALPPLYPG